MNSSFVVNKIENLKNYADTLKPLNRRAIILLIDILCNSICFNYYLYVFSNLNFLNYPLVYLKLYLSFILISTLIYLFTGHYKGLSRYVDGSSFYFIALRNFFISFFVLISGSYLDLRFITSANVLILFLTSTFLVTSTRIILKKIINFNSIKNQRIIKHIVIYGGGAAGAQLGASLKLSPHHKVLFYVDDSSYLWNRTLNGISIFPPEELRNQRQKIDEIFLAIPSLTKSNKRIIVQKLKKLNLRIFEIPSIEELSERKMDINILRPISIEELLGRDIVPPNNFLLNKSVLNQNVCITGAGGSIGSELARQITNLNPNKIVLIERNEFALYDLERKLNRITSNLKIYPILGCITDKKFLEDVIKRYEVEVIFHAAAYKHVPLIESNPISGIINNLNSTKIICEIANKYELSKVVLISTDKAVRPTNVMGCSKRLAELFFQSYSKISKRTIFSIVRFGNVLDSSGSVVPLFKEQIKNGGPITLTDPRVIRFFMTIYEASQLVLQASVLAEGGEVFLLDMGEPVLIRDLATQMIKLSGLSVKDANNPNGDIEIITTGLRPGEKLYEELLIDGESLPTEHPLIFKTKENFLSPNYFFRKIDELQIYLNNYDIEKTFMLLKEIIPEWSPQN